MIAAIEAMIEYEHRPPDYQPEILILGLEESVRRFRNELLCLPLADEIHEVDVYHSIFEYMSEQTNAGGLLLECIREMKEQIAHRHSDEVVEVLGAAMFELCKDILEYITQLKAFSPDGIFWYYFKELAGDAIVLRLAQDEEWIN